VRKFLVDAQQDPRNPELAWKYRELSELVPTRDATKMGTHEELQKLADGVTRYYSDKGQWFDAEGLARDVQLMFAIETGNAD
jgi:hypothetical protein